MRVQRLRRLFTATVLSGVASGLAGGQAPAQAAKASADSIFIAKLAPFKVSGDTTVDVTELRRLYATTSFYSPYDDDRSDQRNRMWKRLDAHDSTAARQIADSVLASDYFDIGAHVGAAIVARERGDSVAWARHAAAARAVIRSIESTGDGLSPEHPFFVLAVDEEYAYLDSRGMRRVGAQALASCGGRECDMLEVAGHDGKTIKLYFDVSLATNWMKQMFSEGEKNDKAAKP